MLPVLLLKFITPMIIPVNIALNINKLFTRLDFLKNVNESFNCPTYSFIDTASIFSSSLLVWLNLKVNIVDNTHVIKHSTIGIYPFIANVTPAITDDIPSK